MAFQFEQSRLCGMAVLKFPLRDVLALFLAACAVAAEAGSAYLVVDVSGGPKAERYPVTHLDAPPPGGWTDRDKTERIVFRRVDPSAYGACLSRGKNPSAPYYLGVFEVTRRQYELVKGSRRAGASEGTPEGLLPLIDQGWDALRGSPDACDWPKVRTVDPKSFVGILRAKTGLAIDLPTEAQWECAARAGRAGCVRDDAPTPGRLTSVGSGKPNPLGFHDLFGNAWERCLDRYTPVKAPGVEYVIRVRRGGDWASPPEMRSASFCGSGFTWTEKGRCEGVRLAFDEPKAENPPVAAVPHLKDAAPLVLEVSPTGLTPQQALARLRSAGTPAGSTVRVKKGSYPLDETLAFGPDDSGAPGAPVRWIGEPGAVLTGGEAVGPWTVRADGTWSAPAPRDAAGRVVWFEQLWVNGRRAARACWPDADSPRTFCDEIEEQPYRSQATGRRACRQYMRFSDPALCGILADAARNGELEYAQLDFAYKWTYGRRVLRGYDAATGWVEMRSERGIGGENGTDADTDDMSSPSFADWATCEMKIRFANLRGAFDAPGEWFLDVKNGLVLYRPLPGETPSAASAVAPTKGLATLVRFAGDCARGAFVHDLSFEGLAFEASATADEATGRTDVPTQSYQLQAAVFMGATIDLKGAHGITFDRCAVRHTGNHAFLVGEGAMSNRLANCRLEDLGGSGLRMGTELRYAKPLHVREGRTTAYTAHSTAFNVVSNCLFRSGGWTQFESCGAAITHASDCAFVHNTVEDFPYTGISVGYVWGYNGSVAQRNDIGFNLVRKIGRELMSDLAGIYCLGVSFGTRVHDNTVTDVTRFPGESGHQGRGMYPDEGGQGIVFANNLVWNASDEAFGPHYCRDITVTNNIFAYTRAPFAEGVTVRRPKLGRLQLVGFGKPSHDGVKTKIDFERNIVYTADPTSGPFIGAPEKRGIEGTYGDNTVWAKDHARADFREDPLFADAARGDFTLRPDSPALKKGFVPFDWRRAGCDLERR